MAIGSGRRSGMRTAVMLAAGLLLAVPGLPRAAEPDSTAWPLGPRGELPVIFTATVREIRPRTFTFAASGRTREANTVKLRVASMVLGDSITVATLVCGNRIVVDDAGVPVSVAEEPGSPWFRPEDDLLVIGFPRPKDSPFAGTLDAPWVRFLPDGPLDPQGRLWRQDQADFAPLLAAKRKGEPVPAADLPLLVDRLMEEDTPRLGELLETLRQYYRDVERAGAGKKRD